MATPTEPKGHIGRALMGSAYRRGAPDGAGTAGRLRAADEGRTDGAAVFRIGRHIIASMRLPPRRSMRFTRIFFMNLKLSDLPYMASSMTFGTTMLIRNLITKADIPLPPAIEAAPYVTAITTAKIHKYPIYCL